METHSKTKIKINKSDVLDFLEVLRPSLLGSFIYGMVIIATIALSQPSQYKDVLMNFNVNQLQGTFIYKYVLDIQKVTSSQIVNEVTVYIFWIFVGLVIFVIASKFTKNVSELTDDIGLRNYMWPKGRDKNAPVKEFIERFLFHVAMFIILVFYLFKATPMLIRYWHGANFTGGLGIHNLIHYLVLIIIEFLYLHIVIIIIRLFLLKKRLVNS